MSRLRHTDILCELIELSQERVQEVRQQLTYYRASVYKAETAANITTRIEQLRLLASLLVDDSLQEAFKDFDAISQDGVMNYIPGECSFSKRVASLLTDCLKSLDGLHNQTVSRGAIAQATNNNEFTDAVRAHRDALLALCRHGSRQWVFFQSI